MKKTFLAITYFFAIFMIGEISFHIYDEKSTEKIQRDLDLIGKSITKSIQEDINSSISATTMNELILKSNNYDTSQFQNWAPLILSNFKAINSIQLAKDGVVSDVYPLEGNEDILGINLLEDSITKKYSLKTLDTNKITFEGPRKLIQSDKLALIIRKPIEIQSNKKNSFWGFTIVVVLIDDIVENRINQFDLEGFNYSIYDNKNDENTISLIKSSKIKPLMDDTRKYQITLPNGTWDLYLESKNSEAEFFIFFHILLLFIGILTAFLIFRYLSKLDYENDKFKILLKNATDGIHILDLKGNLVECSKSFHEDLGYTYEEVLKLNFKDWYKDYSNIKLKKLFKENLKSSVKFHTKFIRKDKTVFDVSVNASVIKIKNEKYIYISSRDITLNVLLENKLKYERDFLDNIFNSSQAIVVTILPDGTMNKVNKYTEEITGYTKEQIASKPFFWVDKFIPNQMKAQIKESINSFVKEGEIITKKENEWIVKNNQRRLFEWTNSIIFENNRPISVLSIGIDITERKKLESKLKESNENLEYKIKEATKKLNHSLEIIEKYIITSKVDLDGNYTEVSEKFCEVFKYSKEELIGKNHKIIKDPNTPDELYNELWETIKGGKIWKGRIKNVDKFGNSHWVDSTFSPLYDENNNHIGYFSHRVDVTEEVINAQLKEMLNRDLKKKVEEQLDVIRHRDLEMLKQARLASLGEMLRNIAHQWRQPLNTILIGSSGVKFGLEFGVLSQEEINQELDNVIQSCEYLTKTIETFTNYLRPNKQYKSCLIEEEIESAKYIINSSLKANLITLIDEMDYSKTYKSEMVENELSQVILNILSNAEFALNENNKDKDKWIKISSQVKGNIFTIMIEDNAGGIPNDIIDKIFEPYFTTKFKSQGTGLGLSMSYSIIKDSIKGDIYVKNTSLGAKFFIELPLSKDK